MRSKAADKMWSRLINTVAMWHRQISAEVAVTPHNFRMNIPIPHELRKIHNITTIRTGNEIIVIADYTAPNPQVLTPNPQVLTPKPYPISNVAKPDRELF